MSAEESSMELQGARDRDAEPKDAAQDPAASQAEDAAEAEAEAESSEADLDPEKQERQPMTGGGDRSDDAPSGGSEAAAAGGEAAEKNGAVKLKIEDDATDVKFTGLNKEELLRVAGTPG